MSRADIYRALPGSILTIALIVGAVYALPRYVDHRIDLYMSRHLSSAATRVQTPEQAASAQRFLDANRGLIEDGLPSASTPLKKGERQVVAFTDYRCTYCKSMESYLAHNEGHLHVIYKELPILGADSDILSIYGYAANSKGRYLDYRSYMRQIHSPNEDNAKYFFEKEGIQMPNPEEIKQYKSLININKALARYLSITGTPTLIIGNKIVHGWDEQIFKSMIDGK